MSREADTKLRNALRLSKGPFLESRDYFSGPESCFMFAFKIKASIILETIQWNYQLTGFSARNCAKFKFYLRAWKATGPLEKRQKRACKTFCSQECQNCALLVLPHQLKISRDVLPLSKLYLLAFEISNNVPKLCMAIIRPHSQQAPIAPHLPSPPPLPWRLQHHRRRLGLFCVQAANVSLPYITWVFCKF